VEAVLQGWASTSACWVFAHFFALLGDNWGDDPDVAYCQVPLSDEVDVFLKVIGRVLLDRLAL
jgi:hypothetical protein